MPWVLTLLLQPPTSWAELPSGAEAGKQDLGLEQPGQGGPGLHRRPWWKGKDAAQPVATETREHTQP